MRLIGIHLRVKTTLSELAERALALKVPIFQLFLMVQDTRKLLTFSPEDIKTFQTIKEKSFQHLYLHGSYLVNLAGIAHNGFHALQREIRLAKILGFDTIVLHPGSAHGARNKEQGIDAVVRSLNELLKREHHMTIILENTAHGKMSIGSDITDFYYIRQKIDQPERIRFCIDTSHAHVFGYDLINHTNRMQFFDLIDTCLGLNNISLIHLNDTRRSCGSRIDQHDAPGEGLLGVDVLHDFVMYPPIAHIPILMELPLTQEYNAPRFLDMVRTWHIKQ